MSCAKHARHVQAVAAVICTCQHVSPANSCLLLLAHPFVFLAPAAPHNADSEYWEGDAIGQRVQALHLVSEDTLVMS